MTETGIIKVAIDPDLLDLAPVLIKSLYDDLEDMHSFIQDGNYLGVREKAHSSRGAALTFGFHQYAEELLNIKNAACSEDGEGLVNVCEKLKLMIDNVEFVPAT